jgi:hypothetical protein
MMTEGPSSGIGGHVRPARRIGTALRAALVVVAAVSLCLSAASCGLRSGSSGDDPSAEQARILELARDDFARAAAALRAGDRDGFLQRFSSEGDGVAAGEARDGLGEVFDTLAPLPWRTFSFEVTPVDAAAGIYRLRGSGQLGPAAPGDRIAVVRYLRLRAAAGGVVVLADETPEDLRRRYLMALRDPIALQRPGLLVLADRRARGRAAAVLAAAEKARPRLAALGVSTRPTVVITVFGSAEDVRDALAVEAATTRLVFFSYPALRVAEETSPTYDVGVTGPWLRDAGLSMEDVLTHELAHAYTLRWFSGDEDPPSLIVEGIAEAAEGSPPGAALREEVETGDQLWPLPESFGVGDVWDGGDGEAVSLGYDVGGALVSYVAARWGADRVRPFAQAVAAAEPTETGMDEALGRALGVTWRAFFAGWRRYVLAGM